MLFNILSIIFLSTVVLGVFIILQRASVVDFLAGFICAILPLEWIIEVRGINISIYDMAFMLGVPVFIIIILRHKYYRNRYVSTLFVLFMVFQLWNLLARFAHGTGNGAIQILWSSYKNNFVGFVFLLTGVILASRPQHIQRRILWILLAAFAFEACVGIIQTATGGVALNGITNGRYLGFLTIVPWQYTSSNLIELQGDGSLDNGTFVGSIFRAVGTLRHSNFFAVSMITGLALCMSVLSIRRYLWLHRWALVVGCLLLIALVLSFTRTGYIALMVMYIWQFFFWRRANSRQKTILLAVIGVCILILVFIFGLSMEIQTFIDTQLGSVALERFRNTFRPDQAREFGFRTTLWNFALARVQVSPWFGVDPPITLKELYPTITVPDRAGLPLHNQIISSIYYGGYMAGILYVSTHIWLLWISMKLRIQVKELPVLSMLVIAANLCFVGLAVESLTIDWMPYTSLQGFFWLVAGIAVMQYYVAPVTEKHPATVNTQSHPVSLAAMPSQSGD